MYIGIATGSQSVFDLFAFFVLNITQRPQFFAHAHPFRETSFDSLQSETISSFGQGLLQVIIIGDCICEVAYVVAAGRIQRNWFDRLEGRNKIAFLVTVANSTQRR
jgi:hypothetical protein